MSLTPSETGAALAALALAIVEGVAPERSEAALHAIQTSLQHTIQHLPEAPQTALAQTIALLAASQLQAPNAHRFN